MTGDRVLHVLSAATGREPEGTQYIEAGCGHLCVGSPLTHDLLRTPGLQHDIYCLPCFMALDIEGEEDYDRAE